jgi:hypothetical protein
VTGCAGSCRVLADSNGTGLSTAPTVVAAVGEVDNERRGLLRPQDVDGALNKITKPAVQVRCCLF